MSDVVIGRKLEISTGDLELSLIVRIQGIIDAGDHDQADRILLTHSVLALRELEDLRKTFNDRGYLKWRRDRFVHRNDPKPATTDGHF